jgi:pimeloyl-ACP methyl ester carboxylesterase
MLLVHGAWHGAWCWTALQAELDRRGVPSYAVDLPGHGASLLEPGDLYGDGDHIGAVAERLGERGDGEIVLVGHSYGGAVISQATKRATNIAHLVYLTAFCLDVGEGVLAKTRSMPSVETELGSGTIQFLPDGSGSTIIPDRAAPSFYGCCAPEVAAAGTARLCMQPMATFTQPVTVAPWKSIPSTYVRCLRDEAIHISHQDLMAGRCGSIGTLDTDHSPFMSAVAETADILEPLARG